MSRRPGLAGLALLAALGGGLVAACGTAAGSASAAPPPLHLYERDTAQATVDRGSPGAGPGDLFVFSGDLFDGGPSGPRTGRADGACTTTSGDATTPGSLVCQIAITLPDGQLQTQAVVESGPFFGGAPAALAIVGGTGDRRGAHGDGTVVVPDVADPSAVMFTLTPQA